MTRPDIEYEVHVVSQFIHPPELLIFLLLTVFWGIYLQGTLADGILLRHAAVSSIIIAYSDADCVGCKIFCQSTTGYAISLAPISLLGHVRNNLRCLNLLLQLSVVLLHMLLLKLFGTACCFMVWVFYSWFKRRCCVTISVPHTSQQIQFIMSTASISQLSTTLFMNVSLMVAL